MICCQVCVGCFMSSAAGGLVSVILSFHYRRFTLMSDLHSCQTWRLGALLDCDYWPVERFLFSAQGWRWIALSVRQTGAFAFNDTHVHVQLTLRCHAFTHHSCSRPLEIFLMKSLPCCSFHPSYSSPFFMLVDLRSLVIYCCHSRGSATLVMVLPHFFISVCAVFTLFLSLPLVFFSSL